MHASDWFNSSLCWSSTILYSIIQYSIYMHKIKLIELKVRSRIGIVVIVEGSVRMRSLMILSSADDLGICPKIKLEYLNAIFERRITIWNRKRIFSQWVFRALSTKHDKIRHYTVDAVSFPKIDVFELSVALITFDGIL
jgi:hypothetical protein